MLHRVFTSIVPHHVGDAGVAFPHLVIVSRRHLAAFPPAIACRELSKLDACSASVPVFGVHPRRTEILLIDLPV